MENNNIMDLNAENNTLLINPSFPSKVSLSPAVKIAVMASGNGSNFEAIARAIDSDLLDAKISILIVNNDDCKAIERAKKFGIHYEYIDHRKFANRNSYDKEIVSRLKYFNVECIVMAGWMRIVTPILINTFPNKIINIHPSILPSFKGTKSIERALNSGVKITGCTIHKVIEEIDSGEIIAQAAVKIDIEDDLSSLTKKIQVLEHNLIPKAIANAVNEWRSSN